MFEHEPRAVRHDGRLVGHLEGPPSETATVRRLDGTVVRVPSSLLHPAADGGYEAERNLDTLRAEEVIPLAEERLTVTKRPGPEERVRVHVRPTERREVVDVPLETERVEVERVAVDRLVDRPEQVRQEGDVTIVPVMEEVLVVEKRLRVREEVRIRRVRSTERVRRAYTLRREEADVHRSRE
jgi:uncharacterized protein (TIGR02271 family)